jgi:formate/nitrite transporter FocA (FNT family)
MDAFTPAQTTELVSRIGAKKARMRIDKMFINSFMGGALISFGCALALSTNTAPWFQTNAPGLIRTIGAMVFPVGLISKLARSRSFNFLEYIQDNLLTSWY